MKFSTLSFGLLAFATTATNAQYFSAGWAPGQAEPTPIPEQRKPAPRALKPETSWSSLSDLFDISKILSSQTSVQLFGLAGINITDRLAGALERGKLWDERVDIITDENYADVIVNEPLTQEEERHRVWFIVISVTSARQDGVSKYLDDVFDTAFNETLIAGDLPHVRWGRIDYLNVTAITTKWAVWQAPYLVILKDRGQTLRFYKPQHLRLRSDALREFLRQDGWKVTPPWSGPYAPGGSREFLMDFLSIWMARMYNAVTRVPRWLLFVISGSIASAVINFLHKGSLEPKPRPQQPSQPKAVTIPAEASASAPASPASAAKRSNAKQRKGKK